MKKLLFLIHLVLFSMGSVIAQVITDEIDLVREMALEEQEIVDAIVLYPKDIRTFIFEASTYPHVIVKLANIQKRTSGQYKEMMMKYPMETQKAVWEMTRYPGLIDQLANTPDKANDIISKQPKGIRATANTIFQDHFPLLKEVSRLEELSFEAFTRVVDPLPAAGKSVFNELIKYPEILGLLNENIEFTILGGDLYKKYPDWVQHHADSLNLVVARQQALELEDWKSQLENDPKAVEELKQATEEFASEYGYENEAIEEEDREVIDDIYYTDDEYEYDDDEYDYDEVEYRTVYRYQYYHYPYWFGYPYWYSYPHWRSYPSWYEWGFYWNSYGGFHMYHMPSPFFMHWYFYHPHHHHHYAHLSYHFVNHYYGHRHHRSSIVGTVHTWRHTNRDVIHDNWVEIDKAERINTLKEFGQMENARVAYNEKNPRNPVTKKDYIKENKGRYPTLEKTVVPKEKAKTPVSKPAREKATPKKPKVNAVPQKPTIRTQPKDRVKPAPKKPKLDTAPKTKAKPVPKTKVNPVPKKPAPRKTNKSVQLKKARDYHKQTWKAPKTKTPVYKKPAVRPKPPTVKQKPRAKPKTKTRKPN